jgi:hypothetical protein
MMGETVQFEKAAEGDAKREQSTILFPYLDLDAAVEVARAVYARAGLGSCGLDELAAEMSQTMSGAFRLKTGTAKTFDLTDKDGKSGIKLSELGRQIVTADTERAARAEAFMRVPLYAAVYEKYKGHLLPPPKALEREMLGLGVSSKQTDKARQAFERSARQAGYFESGDDRLVRPRADLTPLRTGDDSAGNGEAPDRDRENDHRDNGSGRGSGGGGGYHPFIQGLLDTLPSTSDFKNWSADDQAEWLTAAAGIFKLLSKSQGRIRVTVENATVSKNNGGDP